MDYQKIINIAVIAHVDAGKSTTVDAFLKQSHIFKDNEKPVDCVMDSNDLERERGITIYSKNCSVSYKDYKINIVDTPGHADFSSEVERIIKTVDTVISGFCRRTNATNSFRSSKVIRMWIKTYFVN